MEKYSSESEASEAQRFEFGKNWKRYLSGISEESLIQAEKNLSEFLGNDLAGKTFLDIGSGSGIHSLSAKKLGASQVLSFDYDLESVNCTKIVKSLYWQDNDSSWQIQHASVLDEGFMRKLPLYDIVYSWGVLHHTGAMWKAIENAVATVKMGGVLFIAIYNNQGWKSRFWWHIKLIYNKLPRQLKIPYAISLGVIFNILNILKYIALLKPMIAITPILNYRQRRGMSFWTDVLDWIGGFPYEYASTQELNSFLGLRGFIPEKCNPASSLGCHQILYRRSRLIVE